MLIVKVDKNIEKALKILKSKVIKTRQNQKLNSKKEVKKAPVDKQASVTDTLETLMARKKVNQCKAMMIPANNN